jgi:MGT family glycosyltransferase
VGHVSELLDRVNVVIVNSIEEFDPPARTLPANVRFVGPLVEAAGDDAGWTPPFDESRPLVVIGLGTTPMDEGPVLQRVLDALATLPVNVLATVGDHLDLDGFSVPRNAVVSRAVRHAAVMPHASLFIGHGGYSGMSTALSFGVPMVCLPLGRDQPSNGERLVGSGAGVSLAGDAPVESIRDAVEVVLGDGSYRVAAVRLRGAMAACGDGALAVEALKALADRRDRT